MQEHLFSHFSIAGQDGFLNGVSITKTDPFDPLQRKITGDKHLQTQY